jgi:hypothetical protein
MLEKVHLALQVLRIDLNRVRLAYIYRALSARGDIIEMAEKRKFVSAKDGAGAKRG